MALQNYRPMRLPPVVDPLLRNDLLQVDRFLRQLGPFAARVPVAPQGTPGAAVDLTKFLYLPGRNPEQVAYGTNVFFAKNNAEDNNLPIDVYRGFTLLTYNQVSGNSWPYRVYFTMEASANSAVTRQWRFPYLNGHGGQSVFADTTGAQTFTNKTIQASNIYVGTDAASCTFSDSSDGGTLEQFKITVGTSFPDINTSTPVLRIPNLDVSEPLTNAHSFMMLSSLAGAPFTIGSIAHGNHLATEMEMLAAGTNGGVLQYNIGQTVTGTWVAGGTTILSGLWDATKTRPGMRIRGGSSGSVCIPRDAIITVVTDGVLIQIDQNLVGNNAGGLSVTSYGPTWSTSLSGIDHGSLAGLTDDDHTQYLNIKGRTNGQIIRTGGGGSHGGGFGTNTADVAIHGALLIDPFDTGFSTAVGRAFDLRTNPLANVTNVNMVCTVSNSVVNGTAAAMQIQVMGTMTAGGTSTIRGINFINTAASGTGSTVDECIAAIFQNTATVSGTGNIDKMVGGRFTGRGASGTHVNGTTALELFTGNVSATTTLKHLHLKELANPGGTISEWCGIDYGTTAILDDNAIVDYFCLRIPDLPTNPTGTLRGLHIGTIPSHHVGPFRFGSTTTPTHSIEIAAGTTTRAPLLLTSGTSLTAAVAGAIEFTTDDFFATITTGPAQKAFVLDDGTRLTSGKIPVATTNGRLIDLVASSAYTPTNVTTDRAYDADATTIDELADILGTVIADLQAKGILG